MRPSETIHAFMNLATLVPVKGKKEKNKGTKV